MPELCGYFVHVVAHVCSGTLKLLSDLAKAEGLTAWYRGGVSTFARVALVCRRLFCVCSSLLRAQGGSLYFGSQSALLGFFRRQNEQRQQQQRLLLTAQPQTLASAVSSNSATAVAHAHAQTAAQASAAVVAENAIPLSSWQTSAAGFISRGFGTFSAFPLTVVKTRTEV